MRFCITITVFILAVVLCVWNSMQADHAAGSLPKELSRAQDRYLLECDQAREDFESSPAGRDLQEQVMAAETAESIAMRKGMRPTASSTPAIIELLAARNRALDEALNKDPGVKAARHELQIARAKCGVFIR